MMGEGDISFTMSFGGEAQEDVRPGQGFFQRTVFRLGELRLRGVQVDAARMDQPLGVEHVNMLAADTQGHVEFGAGNARGSCPDDDDFQVFQLAPRPFRGVQQGRAGDHGRAVLVVMEHGNVHFFAEAFLHHEAFRRLDVFQVDRAEGGLHGLDDLNQFFRLLDVQLDIENVDIREHLE